MHRESQAIFLLNGTKESLAVFLAALQASSGGITLVPRHAAKRLQLLIVLAESPAEFGLPGAPSRTGKPAGACVSLCSAGTARGLGPGAAPLIDQQ